MTSRTAACTCGQLCATVEGEPDGVAICNCNQCQSRTGSAYSVHSFFRHSQTTLTGVSRTFTRMADSGRSVTFHFCPDCGSSVYWQTQVMPDSWGIAVGAFRDTTFPPPQRAIWASKKLNWVEFPAGLPVQPVGGPPPGLMPPAQT